MERSFGFMDSLMRDHQGVGVFHWGTAKDYEYSGERNQRVMGNWKGLSFLNESLTSCEMFVDLLYPQGLGNSLPAIFSPWVSSESIAEEAFMGQLERLLEEHVDVGKVSESCRKMLVQRPRTGWAENSGDAWGNGSAEDSPVGGKAWLQVKQFQLQK